MSSDDLMRAQFYALRATVEAIVTHLRETLPEETVNDLRDRAEKLVREQAPSYWANEAATQTRTFFGAA